MIIKSLELENIRSYIKEKIIFESGINFLSGDIGCGKSSILQAIEFCFLGFKRGDLEGAHLLRKGEKEGTVKLVLDFNGSYIEIFRKLKKSKSGTITQENGYILEGKNLLELAPSELNYKIFEILNFPKEFLSKDKNLIYRFTIYTPQEQLKDILFSDSEKRLEIIRKIFSIDKYKQLKNAISIYNLKIREDKKFFEAKIDGNENLDDKIKNIELDILKNEDEILKLKLIESPLNSKIVEIKNNQNHYNDLLDKIRTKIILLEKNISRICEIEIRSSDLLLDLKKMNLDIENFNKIDFDLEINLLFKNIEKLNLELKKLSSEKGILKNKDTEIKLLEKNNLNFDFEIKSIKKLIDSKNTELLEINHLSNCPTCKQEVSISHKNKFKLENEKITIEKNNEIEILEKKTLENKNKIIKFLNNLGSIDEQLYTLNLNEKNLEKKISNFNLDIEKLKNNKDKKDLFNLEISKIKNKLEEQKKIILKKSDFIEKNNLLKEKEIKVKLKLNQILMNLEKLNLEEKDLSNQLIRINLNLDFNLKNLKELKSEKNKLEKNKLLYSNLLSVENFLSNKLVNISENIETFVFTKFYSEFNEEFENFFKDLIEDNEIEIRLDSSFTPIIEQNGYDLNISNLSGGEKSSLAISYRFGLKKIIENNLNSKQKLSLLILDEPTDGFSTNQVDRLGEILKNLNLKQIILVSHDNRIDSICDKIIKIEKENHISFVSN